MNAFIQLMLERHNWLVKTIRVPSSKKKKKKKNHKGTGNVW